MTDRQIDLFDWTPQSDPAVGSDTALRGRDGAARQWPLTCDRNPPHPPSGCGLRGGGEGGTPQSDSAVQGDLAGSSGTAEGDCGIAVGTRPGSSEPLRGGKDRERKRPRKTYLATVVLRGLVAELLVKGGAWLRWITFRGEVTREHRDPSARLWTNLGDRFLLLPSNLELDDVAAARVVRVYEDNPRRIDAVIFRGALPPTTGEVQLMRLAESLREHR